MIEERDWYYLVTLINQDSGFIQRFSYRCFNSSAVDLI